MTTAQLHALASTANPATAADIRRQLGAERPARQGGGVSAFHRIERYRLGPFRSKTETYYAARLEAQKHIGQIIGWDYESDRLKLADSIRGGKDKTRDSWFRTDFTVYHAGGFVSWDEVKGGWMTEAGRLRFRWLCERYPVRWLRLWRYEGGVWTLAVEGGRPEGATG